MERDELCWVAGLLEGEGCFGIAKGKPTKDGRRHLVASIQVNMNDEDVMRRLHGLVGCGAFGGPYGTKRTDGVKSQGHYKISILGSRAVDLMRELLSTGMMGSRRTARINEVIASHDTYA